MILGALIDAGVPLDEVRTALGSLAIASDTIWIDRVTRAGISAAKFCVRGEDDLPIDHADDHDIHDHHHHPEHHHEHDHHHHHDTRADGKREQRHYHVHRSLAEVGRIIDRCSLSATGKARAQELFRRLGEAEAVVHGMPLEEVHLHEVGALDSIVDIVGSVFALEFLKADRIVSSPLNVGSGSIRLSHGTYPVPAPATIRLLQGAPIYAGPQRAEMDTATRVAQITLRGGVRPETGEAPARRRRRSRRT